MAINSSIKKLLVHAYSTHKPRQIQIDKNISRLFHIVENDLLTTVTTKWKSGLIDQLTYLSTIPSDLLRHVQTRRTGSSRASSNILGCNFVGVVGTVCWGMLSNAGLSLTLFQKIFIQYCSILLDQTILSDVLRN